MTEPVEEVPNGFVLQVLGAKEVERLWLMQRVAALEAKLNNIPPVPVENAPAQP